VVDGTTRRCNNDIDAPAECLELSADRLPAINGQNPSGFLERFSASRCSSIGRAKAAVLPVPVAA
jgi:hypothetical protein